MIHEYFLNMTIRNYLLLILSLVVFSKFAAATDGQDSPLAAEGSPSRLGSYGLTAQQETVFVESQNRYMLMLNSHCDYPTGKTFKLPPDFLI